MNNKLEGKNVAILATNGFEDSELRSPLEALRTAGANVMIVSLDQEEIKGWSNGDWHGKIKVDTTVKESAADQFDALVLPGGVINPDLLRRDPDAVKFVKDFFKQKKPVAAICHGPWMLAEAGVLKGRKITSYASIRTDMVNAGANWVDEEVVVDEGLVTSRSPKDLPAFNAKMVEEIAEGKHAEQTA
ncbi:MAG: type 1 glutamine amidotransferase [Flavobacteriales bacterium]|nr:type 1 glutamine amidotransferase [Flavobacteriales bacterium]